MSSPLSLFTTFASSLTALTPLGFTFFFISVMLGSLGLPGDLLLEISFGALANNIPMLVVVILIAFLATAIGDIIAYEIAYKISDPLLFWLRKYSFFNKVEPKAREKLSKYEFSLIFVTRFTFTGLSTALNYIAGLEKLKRRKFYLAVLTGDLIQGIIYPVIGFAVGSTINSLISSINDVLIALFFILIIFYLFRNFLIKKRKK